MASLDTVKAELADILNRQDMTETIEKHLDKAIDYHRTDKWWETVIDVRDPRVPGNVGSGTYLLWNPNDPRDPNGNTGREIFAHIDLEHGTTRQSPTVINRVIIARTVHKEQNEKHGAGWFPVPNTSFDAMRSTYDYFIQMNNYGDLENGDPYMYCVHEAHVLFWPAPKLNGNPFHITILGQQELTDSRHSGVDGFSTKAGEVILQRARMTISRDVLNDMEMAGIAELAWKEARRRIFQETSAREGNYTIEPCL